MLGLNTNLMKHIFSLALFVALIFSSSSALGQIQDDENSYSLLAAQCLMSARMAGRTDASLSDYSDYATSLAKTISALSAEQQGRIFSPATGGAASDSTSSSSTETAGPAAVESGLSGLLSGIGDAIIDSVGNLNDFIAGESGVEGGSKNKSKNVPNGNAYGWWKKNGDTTP